MKILVVNTYPSWGTSLELVQKVSGLINTRSHAEIPDGMQFKELEALKLLVQEKGINAVVLDNHWVPAGIVPVSLTLLQIAEQLRMIGAETFYLNNQNESSPTDARRRKSYGAMLYQNDFSCELCRAFKPVKLAGEEKSSLRTVSLAQFCGKLFDPRTGEVKQRSFGDDGFDEVAHWIQNGYAMWERDWLAIAQAIERELAS